MKVSFTVNGREVSLEVDPAMPLLWALRDELRLTGTKYGCGIAQCGACTVHVNGQAQRACVTPVQSVQGATVVTIEGLDGPVATALRAAWQEVDVPQCGYCQSGQIMSAAALLASNPRPSDEQIDRSMSGCICRCATYARIRRAIHDTAERLEA